MKMFEARLSFDLVDMASIERGYKTRPLLINRRAK
jgi:hypothetical protein